jgi:hypothetical protein
MAEFKLDTRGEVRGRRLIEGPDGSWRSHWAWHDLDDSPVVQGYIEAALSDWRDRLQIASRLQFQRELFAGFSDLAAETLARIIADCAKWQREWAPSGNQSEREQGQTLWRGRQLGNLKAVGFPPLTLYLGDDGKVHIRDE